MLWLSWFRWTSSNTDSAGGSQQATFASPRVDGLSAATNLLLILKMGGVGGVGNVGAPLSSWAKLENPRAPLPSPDPRFTKSLAQTGKRRYYFWALVLDPDEVERQRSPLGA